MLDQWEWLYLHLYADEYKNQPLRYRIANDPDLVREQEAKWIKYYRSLVI